METIFDHNPTPEELRAIGCDWFTPAQYSLKSEETAWFDLVLLFRERGDTEGEARAWSHIPERRDEFFRGFDCLDVES